MAGILKTLYIGSVSGLFIIYMGSRRAIYNDIAASTSVIFRPIKTVNFVFLKNRFF